MHDGWLRGLQWVVLVGFVSGLGMIGCSTVHPRTAVGTGTYSYVTRSLAWTYPYTVDEVWTATLLGLAEMDYGIQTQTFDGLGGRLEAQAAVGSRISLEVRPEGQSSTRLKVHVHRFINRHESERVHEVIRQKLGHPL